MGKRRKLFWGSAVVLIMALMLLGCGGEQTLEEGAAASEDEVKGTISDTGVIKALCPDGWKSFSVPDLKAAGPDVVSKNALRFVKNGKEKEDLLTNAFIEIEYYSSENDIKEIEAEKWYDNLVKIDSLVTGEHEWKGYSGITMGTSFVYLETQNSGDAYTIMLFTHDGSENSVSLYDAEVQAILKSIELSETKIL